MTGAAWRRFARMIALRSGGEVTVIPPDDMSIPERAGYRSFREYRAGPPRAPTVQPPQPAASPPRELLVRLANPRH